MPLSRALNHPADPARPVIVWFRQDLRLADNRALSAAIDSRAPLVCVYVLDDDTAGPWKIGAAQRVYLHHSLQALDASLRERGARLVLLRGNARAVILDLVAQISAQAVYWNRQYEPYAIARDRDIKLGLAQKAVFAQSFNSALLHEPWEVQTQGGKAFKVFSPFHRACEARWASLPRVEIADAVSPAPSIRTIDQAIASDGLMDWGLLPKNPPWADRFFSNANEPKAGEALAYRSCMEFLDGKLGDYASGRDFPARDAGSNLSAALHFGEISPRQIRDAIAHSQERRAAAATSDVSHAKFIQELNWREFAYHLLFHFPDFPDKPWRRDFEAFAWREDASDLRAWQKGETGIPIIDAGMRELWATGRMHNRVRMLVASFLTKHLLIDWRKGQEWFWDCLIDADLASNSVSWQWVAGSGADSAPYFRIFNPVLQSEKFDPEGAYIRRWVPELAALPNAWLHAPWSASAAELSRYNVTIGQSYPAPIIDLKFGRERALIAFHDLPKPDIAQPKPGRNM